MSFGRIIDLRNNTASDILIEDLGVILPANASDSDTNVVRITDYVDDNALDASLDLRALIESEDVGVNGQNGNGDGTAFTNLALDQALDEISITLVDTDPAFSHICQGGLDVYIRGGMINYTGTIYTVTGTILTLTDNATNYVYVDTEGNITHNTTGFITGRYVPLYVFETSAGEIESCELEDVNQRTYINNNIETAGETGVQGHTGPQGLQGATGVQGPQGNQGPLGETGLQGPLGETGIQGIQGIQGNQGATGIRGLTGPPGSQGPRGYTGTQGVQGIQGPVGTQGETGVGVQGETGICGCTGPSGEGCTPAAVQVRRTTDYSIQGSFQDVSFDTTDLETNSDVLEHDDSHKDRIKIKKNGTYLIAFSTQLRPTNDDSRFDMRVRKNDSTVLPSSEHFIKCDTNDIYDYTHTFVVELEEDDYVSVQVKHDCTGELEEPICLAVVRIDGCRGDTGARGTTGPEGGPPGATGIQGVTGLQGPEGEDGDQGETGIQGVTGPTGDSSCFGTYFKQESESWCSDTSDTSYQQKQRMNTGSIPAGTYRIGWYYEWRNNSLWKAFQARVQVDDDDTLSEHVQAITDTGSGQSIPTSGFCYVTFTGEDDHNIDLDYCAEYGSTSYIKNTRLEIWRVC